MKHNKIDFQILPASQFQTVQVIFKLLKEQVESRFSRLILFKKFPTSSI